ncbi:diguanylate cyclase [Rhodanobacter ginsengisoli]|uniref:diguanylate cyclase n=1 Tax=Rhodanobacter ginsengisoli TaxID=418646 RepID=A0ABW0QKQ2_9GAMM
MEIRTCSARLLLLALLLVCGNLSATVTLRQMDGRPLGTATSYLQETTAPLTLEQALSAYGHGAFTASLKPVLTFGIGPKPVWIHLGIDNDAAATQIRRLTVGISWLDHVDIYVRHDDRTTATWRMGDRLPFALRPIDSHVFAADVGLPPGRSDLMLRIATFDPMVLPISLQAPAQAASAEGRESASYAFIYGFMFALLAYNLMLFIGMHASRYGLYSLYLATFMLTNVAYTGYGFQWLWPTHPGWTQWSQPTLMILCASCGLLFARNFLDTHRHFPRLHRGILACIAIGALALVGTALIDWQSAALVLAFAFVTVFTVLMLGLGVLSVRAGLPAGRYFLLAAACSMAGDVLTVLAVLGIVPFDDWTFRAAEAGMLLDATLLALALTYQFREGEERREKAEHLARLDPLTGINNRRSFDSIGESIWSIARRNDRHLSVIVLDLDHFKRINDAHGHACGDEVLKATANLLHQTLRDSDIIARWGGEEFIVLLPETGLAEAVALAERLRDAIANLCIIRQGVSIKITASLGVTERRPGQQTLEALIAEADHLMYQAKDLERNRVCHTMEKEMEVDG